MFRSGEHFGPYAVIEFTFLEFFFSSVVDIFMKPLGGRRWVFFQKETVRTGGECGGTSSVENRRSVAG
jgi:hypothetical protein